MNYRSVTVRTCVGIVTSFSGATKFAVYNGVVPRNQSKTKTENHSHYRRPRSLLHSTNNVETHHRHLIFLERQQITQDVLQADGSLGIDFWVDVWPQLLPRQNPPLLKMYEDRAETFDITFLVGGQLHLSNKCVLFVCAKGLFELARNPIDVRQSRDSRLHRGQTCTNNHCCDKYT